MNVIAPLLIALMTAVGNGIFAYGQRKSAGVENSLVFITIALVLCVCCCLLSAPFLGKVDYYATLRGNLLWAAVSGFGLYLTYIGFNLLYSNYGAASYILYAVLSILTTTVVVGGLLLKENLNLYHWLAVVFALITVALFSWGNKVG